MLIVIYKIFAIPISVLIMRLILIKLPNAWCKTNGYNIEFTFKSRKYPSKFPELQDTFIAYWLKVKYTYSVNNKEYSSTRLSMDIANRIYSKEDLDKDTFLLSLHSDCVSVYYFKYFPRLSVMTMPFQKGIDHIVFIFALIMILVIVTVFVKIAYPPGV